MKKFLIASAVRAIMAQRLVRGICKDCAQPSEMSYKEVRSLRLTEDQLSKAEIKIGTGCRTCRMTGFKGRMGCFEIFNISEEVRPPHQRRRIHQRPAPSRARAGDERTLREDGIRKVLAGKTTASEVIRVTMADSD